MRPADAIELRVEPPLRAASASARRRRRRRRLRRLAGSARRARSSTAAPAPTPRSGALSRCLRRARLVGVAARSPDLRARRCSRRISARPADASAAAGRTASRRRGAAPFATLESPPLCDIVRDVNKLSNNVMARQLFLTLATPCAPPPATTARATDGGAALARAAQAQDAGARARQRLGTVAPGAHQRRQPRPPAARGRRERRARGVRELAGGRRDGRHRAAALPERQRRRTGAAQDRHARRRARARRLRDRRPGPPVRRRRDRQSRERGAGAGALDFLVQWVYRDAGTWTPPR